VESGRCPCGLFGGEIDAAIGIESIGVYIMPELGLYRNSIAAALTLLSSVRYYLRIREFSRKVPLYLGSAKSPAPTKKKKPLKGNNREPLSFWDRHGKCSGWLKNDFGSFLDTRASQRHRTHFSYYRRSRLLKWKRKNCWRMLTKRFEKWLEFRL